MNLLNASHLAKHQIKPIPFRFLSSEASSASSSKGGGFFQRLSSFIVGAGVTALGTQFFIFQEIHEGNKIMLEKQKSLEKRITQLEKK
mmetsp:Transcript_8534/g.12160  ORF Transcript_8534/g.12160 Transcript_8534/m.12160 type:complete len:88 (-) Transcript_8534:404-667(-)